MERTLYFLIIFLLMIDLVLAQQKATVVTEQIKRPNLLQQILQFIIKYAIWIILFFVVIILIVFIVILIKNLKKRLDPFKVEYLKVKKLCKIHKDPTIKKIYSVAEGHLQLLGYYLGECYTQDGYMNFMLWKYKKWYLFWVPTKLDFLDLAKDIFIVRCNMNDTFKEKIIDPQTKEEKIIEHKLAVNLFWKTGDTICIRCWGIEPVHYFYYPIIRDENGNLVNKSLEIFEREKNEALINTMYQQVEDFANVSRELISLNPRVRYISKTGESPEK